MLKAIELDRVNERETAHLEVRFMKEDLRELVKIGWEFCQGKKTYVVAIAAVIYGLYAGDKDAVLLGLGLLGLRNGISTEIAKVLINRKK